MNEISSDPAAPAIYSSLRDKSVLIFGGTSGIGLTTALQAKALGAVVTVVGSDQGRSRAAGELNDLSWLSADVSRPEEIEVALKQVASPVDHLVLLAGTFIVGKVMETDVSVFRKAFDERIWAAVHILQMLGDKLAPDASITLVSGVATGRASGDGTAVIAAACGAIETFGRHLALELAPRRVNTVSPGPIDSPLLRKAFGPDPSAYVPHLAGQVPIGRIGSTEEAASAVVFLMANPFMNGTVLGVDGGMSLT